MRHRTTIQRLLFRALLPFAAPQGLFVKARARRAPEAAGPRAGAAGEGAPFRLLCVGDSIVAGVGVDLLANAMPGRLAAALAATLRRRVAWSALGRSGLDAGGTRLLVIRELAEGAADCVFVSVGVNDVTGLRSTSRWRRDLGSLLGELRARRPHALIVVSGLPPLHRFPALPFPLREVLGLRARTFDDVAEELTRELEGVAFVRNAFDPGPSAFAEDGYHPASESCAAWAELIASVVAPALLQRAARPRA